MRAIAYFLYDPQAPRGDPATRARMEGAARRFCDAGRYTLERAFAYPLGQTDPAQAVDALCLFLEAQKTPFLVTVANPLHLGKTPEQGVESLLRLDSLGARMVCIQEGRQDPLRELYDAMAPAQEAGQTSDRAKHIRDAMYRKAARGEGLGRPPYGYHLGPSGKLEEVPEQGQVVRLIFHLYLEQGLGLRNIVRELNNQGHRTLRGQNWSMVSIRDILRNSAYVGTYRRFGLRLPRSHPPIVDREVFRRAQDLLESRTPRRRQASPQPFLLSGLAVCSQCGNHMIGVTRRQSWRNKDGQRMHGVYRYYQCQSRTNQSVCQYHTWRASALEEAVAAELRRQITAKPELLRPSAEGLRQAPPATTAHEAHREQYLAHVKQAAEGVMTLSRLREVLAKLQSPAAGKGAAQEQAPAGEGAAAGEALLDEARWQSLDDARKRQELARWIDHIAVGDKDIYVTLKAG
ncbi:MAG: recombinase family protein [Chloroflexi bacterium]|nr:recombinase family protein [Chloroflexota bacterium]